MPARPLVWWVTNGPCAATSLSKSQRSTRSTNSRAAALSRKVNRMSRAARPLGRAHTTQHDQGVSTRVTLLMWTDLDQVLDQKSAVRVWRRERSFNQQLPRTTTWARSPAQTSGRQSPSMPVNGRSPCVNVTGVIELVSLEGRPSDGGRGRYGGPGRGLRRVGFRVSFGLVNELVGSRLVRDAASGPG
jgi:hypothetical protein